MCMARSETPSASVVIHPSHLELVGMVKRGGLGGLARTYCSDPVIHTISVALRLSRPDRRFEKFKMSVLQLVWAAARWADKVRKARSDGETLNNILHE